MARQGRNGRRHAVLGLVIVVHAVLVALVLSNYASIAVRRETDASPLIFITPTASIPPPSAVPPSRNSEKRSSATLPEQAAIKTGDFAISLDTQAAPSLDALPLRLGIDWDQQAATVASSQAASIFRELKRVCAEAARRGEEPPGCHRYRKPDPWSPEPKKFGFAGGLPYVRLGKRCVLGLGFFGCGFGGSPPEPNGHLLDDMRDPDRPRSSVPDPNEMP